MGCRPVEFPVPNLTDYVVAALGERCPSAAIAVPTTFIYALLLLLGVVGNVCTCVVISRTRSLHSPTNFYLLSLAVSDILVLVTGLPMELYGVLEYAYPYTFGEAVCRARAFLIEFTSYASILVIVSFSVERWLAICFPLQVKLSSTLGRAYTVILIVWAVSFVAALPMAFIVVINRLPLPDFARHQNWTHLVSSDGETLDYTEYCAMDARRPAEQKFLIYFAFIVFFLLPALLISLLYSHIAIRLKSADRYLRSEGGKGKTSKGYHNRRSVLQVLVSVVVTFFVFWLPFHVQRLLSVFLMDNGGDVSAAVQFLFTCVFYISGYCYYSNSVCNPILYNVLSENFRRAFCHTILGEKIARRLVPNWSSVESKLHPGQRTPSRQMELSSGAVSRSLVVGKHSVARPLSPLVESRPIVTEKDSLINQQHLRNNNGALLSPLV